MKEDRLKNVRNQDKSIKILTQHQKSQRSFGNQLEDLIKQQKQLKIEWKKLKTEHLLEMINCMAFGSNI